MELLTPTHFPDYELIDCGNFEKLERFGKFITIRPEPQALWDPILPEKEWQKRANMKFVPRSSSFGDWEKKRDAPDRWNIEYPIERGPSIKFRLALTSFKHVGIFPEQSVNWDYIYQSVKSMKTPQPKDGIISKIPKKPPYY